jgi:RNA polymerase sigma-70 factor (ECF subfamily)
MDDWDQSPEAEWVRLAKAGDKAAFGELVRAYMRQAYYVALGFLGNHDDALDASQEAFVKAYAALKDFDRSRRFFTWYYAILRNHCLNMIRRKSIRPISFSALERGEHEHQSSDQSSEDELIRSETHALVWGALWKLGPDDRQLIVARDILGTPYALLAELLEVPLGTVMSRLYHARRRLRSAVEELQ